MFALFSRHLLYTFQIILNRPNCFEASTQAAIYAFESKRHFCLLGKHGKTLHLFIANLQTNNENRFFIS